ncbi:hypothetical protein Bca4012_071772 [Brassica carinata]|uniref:Uncharacterized protein n=2 Tax=Brassica cretica TaxID=69181 RepID=A0ABQ7ENU0_BRACR|nr:hypothetical protein F2Q69_00028067 [Brassica cretica]KAF3605398.1 hypothetical protein DY000_02047142 [Brassica cretica]
MDVERSIEKVTRGEGYNKESEEPIRERRILRKKDIWRVKDGYVLQRVGDRDTCGEVSLMCRFLQRDAMGMGCGSVHQSQWLSPQRVLVLDVMRAYTYHQFLFKLK